MGRKLLLPALSAPCRLRLVLLSLYFGTSFQHALYRLMRNLLKIPRRASGVNGAGTGGCTTATGQASKESRMPVPGLALAENESAISAYRDWSRTDG
jgi:hypothetical protein